MTAREKTIDVIKELLDFGKISPDDIPSNVMRNLKVDVWIDREDVCIGCHNDNCEGCEYVKYFKE
jgi:hypothetical protein